MDFLNKLNEIKRFVLEEWVTVTLDAYPFETANFLKNQKDPFANPVGQTITDSLSNLLDGLICGAGVKELEICVKPITKIRAVQNFEPSVAVSFVFDLKSIILRCSRTGQICGDFNDDLVLFNDRIDALAMVFFDAYMACREQIYELKANEAKNQFFGSLSRAGLIKEI